MTTNIRYILITAVRDRVFIGLLAGIILSTFISMIMGGTALIETQQMTISFTAASARSILLLSLVVFTCFHIRQSFDTKEMDVLLSRPLSRYQVILSFWFGFSVIALMMVAPIIIVIAMVGVLSQTGFMVWSLSIILEALFVVAFALFASITLRSTVFSVLATIGFYLLGRMMGFFVATAQSGSLFQNADINISLRYMMDVFSLIVPRLDFFSKSEWLIYGLSSYNALYYFILQAVIYIPFLLIMAMLDFRKREF